MSSDNVKTKNEYGDTMEIGRHLILKIEHSDIGLVYHMPDGLFYTFVETKVEGINIEPPIMIPSYAQVILSDNEWKLIKEYIKEE